MCGIVGYIGNHQADPILLEGLKRLEYRGYDSAGLCVFQNGGFKTVRRTGRVEQLARAIPDANLVGTVGISHTRWATHGDVTESNTHPHTSSDGRISLVHNGVIENHTGIRKFCESKGYTFSSQTDTEALANLIAYHYEKEPENEGKSRFVAAVRKSLMHIEGTYGIAVLCKDHPDEMVGARKGSPLVIGIGNEENMIGSDIAAFAGRTKQVVYLDDGQVVHLKADDFIILTSADESISPVISEVDWEIEQAELGSFAHFMEKEIFEQPIALENAMRGRFSEDGSTAQFGGLNLDPKDLHDQCLDTQ